MTEFPDLSLFQAAAALRSGAMTSRALVQAVLDRIVARKDRDAFTHVAADALADAADAMLAAGHDPGPFCGLPVAVKDMTDVAGQPATSGSAVLADRIAATDSPAVARLRAQGAVLIGKVVTYGRPTLQCLAFGAALSDADLALARSAVAPLTAAMLAAMDGVDRILTATTLTAALPFSAFDGEKAVWTPMRTIPFNLTGQPPCHFRQVLTGACPLARNWWAASATTTLSAPPPTPLNAAPTTPPSARLYRVAPAHQTRGQVLISGKN